jgi:hypothetical protein
MSRATHALSAPQVGCNPAPVALPEWKAAVSVWTALPLYSCRRFKVCKHLLELQTRLGSEAALIAQEAANG